MQRDDASGAKAPQRGRVATAARGRGAAGSASAAAKSASAKTARAAPRPKARAGAKRATRDPEGTRAKILAAATAEFARHGLGGARVDRIARVGRINKRMLYYYFGDKDELFRAVLERAYEEIRTAERELNLLALPPLEGIRGMVAFTWRYYLEHPEFLTLLNSENLHRGRHLKRSREIQALNSPVIEILRALLDRGAAAGEIRAGIDPLQLYISIAGLCWFYLSNNHTLSQAFDKRLADPRSHPARLAHMEEVIMGYVTAGARGARR